jgi:hypothetical protein
MIRKVVLMMLFSMLTFGVYAELPMVSRGQTVYVPVYSHIYSGDKEKPFPLTVTVSIRNTDPNKSITVTRADYFGTKGEMLNKYVDKPLTLGAMSTLRYVIKQSERKGGSGANFIVEWNSDTPVNEPIVESVMIGTQTGQGISFTSRGRVISNEN